MAWAEVVRYKHWYRTKPKKVCHSRIPEIARRESGHSLLPLSFLALFIEKGAREERGRILKQFTMLKAKSVDRNKVAAIRQKST